MALTSTVRALLFTSETSWPNQPPSPDANSAVTASDSSACCAFESSEMLRLSTCGLKQMANGHHLEAYTAPHTAADRDLNQEADHLAASDHLGQIADFTKADLSTHPPSSIAFSSSCPPSPSSFSQCSTSPVPTGHLVESEPIKPTQPYSQANRGCHALDLGPMASCSAKNAVDKPFDVDCDDMASRQELLKHQRLVALDGSLRPVIFASGINPCKVPLPLRTHQPRRSKSSLMQTQVTSSSSVAIMPPPALPCNRRPSDSSDSPPLPHAAMVGSYEESILHGRMSTNPSKPLCFLAQIGVLGKGRHCQPSLRSPPQVALWFDAVFYSYKFTPRHPRSLQDDKPSPYVGQIDLENGLANHKAHRRAAKKQQLAAALSKTSPAGIVDPSPYGDSDPCTDLGPKSDTDTDSDFGSDLDSKLDLDPDSGTDDSDVETATAVDLGQEPLPIPEPSEHPSVLPKRPPGGSYRIPRKGQIQIVIKNQNTTSMKLFLIPYNLAGMEPGTKTFVRQRSYGAGFVPGAWPAQSPPSPPAPSDHAQPTAGAPVPRRSLLRYLIHLHICCLSRSRFYLYRTVQIVFASRVSDGKERLRIETSWPEPRFSHYNPVRPLPPPLRKHSHPLARPFTLLANRARRRSSGSPLASGYDTPESPAREDAPVAPPLLHQANAICRIRPEPLPPPSSPPASRRPPLDDNHFSHQLRALAVQPPADSE